MTPNKHEQELIARKHELEIEIAHLEKALFELRKMIPLEDLSDLAREIVRSMYANGWQTDFEVNKERTLWTFTKVLPAKYGYSASRIEGADADILDAARRACLGAGEVMPACVAIPPNS